MSEEAVYLYVTSFIGSKPFAMLPMESEATNLLRLQATNELLMLIDTETDPYRKTTKGGIFLYEINSEKDSE
jgi:hypothetical protein